MVSVTSSTGRLMPPKERLRDKAFQYCQRLIEQSDRSMLCSTVILKRRSVVGVHCSPASPSAAIFLVYTLYKCGQPSHLIFPSFFFFFSSEAQKKTDTELQKAVSPFLFVFFTHTLGSTWGRGLDGEKLMRVQKQIKSAFDHSDYNCHV